MSAWTAKDDEKLKRLTNAGYTAAEIVLCFQGRTRNAIIGRWHRLNIAPGNNKNTNAIRQSIVKSKQRCETKADPKVLWPIVPVFWECEKSTRKLDVKPMPMDISYKPGAEAPEPLNLELLELTENMCRWPVTNGDPFLFCGHTKGLDGPYCPYHHALSRRSFVLRKRLLRDAA